MKFFLNQANGLHIEIGKEVGGYYIWCGGGTNKRTKATTLREAMEQFFQPAAE